MGWKIVVSMHFKPVTATMGKMTARCEVLLDEKLMYPRRGEEMIDEETIIITQELVNNYKGLDMHGWKKKVW